MIIKAFDHIAGCSLGTWSDAESVIACLDFIQTIENAPEYNESFPDMAKHWRELAVDLATSEEQSLDLDYYSGLVEHYCEQALPYSCAYSWQDGEFRVTPYVDDCAETFEDTPETFVDDYVYVVNDHGNVSCMVWDHNNREYNELWAMV